MCRNKDPVVVIYGFDFRRRLKWLPVLSGCGPFDLNDGTRLHPPWGGGPDRVATRRPRRARRGQDASKGSEAWSARRQADVHPSQQGGAHGCRVIETDRATREILPPRDVGKKPYLSPLPFPLRYQIPRHLG